MKTHQSYTCKTAFTMLELVFVIVTLGILASIGMSGFERDIRQEAANSILADIRYTQHMALVDFRHSWNTPTWQRSFWKINFENCADGAMFLSVDSDKDFDNLRNIDREEAAIDPANGLPMFWSTLVNCQNGGDQTVSDRIFITKKYGITAVNGAGGCAGIQQIGFDHLGRPHVGYRNSGVPDYSSYMDQACVFTFTMPAGNFQISIQPETGYAEIVNQIGS